MLSLHGTSFLFLFIDLHSYIIFLEVTQDVQIDSRHVWQPPPTHAHTHTHTHTHTYTHIHTHTHIHLQWSAGCTCSCFWVLVTELEHYTMIRFFHTRLQHFHVPINTYVLVLASERAIFGLIYYTLLSITSFSSLGKFRDKQMQQ